MRQIADVDPIYLSDPEIAKRVSMSPQEWEAVATVLERSGLPKRDPLFKNQRCWPNVRGFLLRRAGHEDPGSRAGIVENFSALRAAGKRSTRS